MTLQMVYARVSTIASADNNDDDNLLGGHITSYYAAILDCVLFSVYFFIFLFFYFYQMHHTHKIISGYNHFMLLIIYNRHHTRAYWSLCLHTQLRWWIYMESILIQNRIIFFKYSSRHELKKERKNPLDCSYLLWDWTERNNRDRNEIIVCLCYCRRRRFCCCCCKKTKISLCVILFIVSDDLFIYYYILMWLLCPFCVFRIALCICFTKRRFCFLLFVSPYFPYFFSKSHSHCMKIRVYCVCSGEHQISFVSCSLFVPVGASSEHGYHWINWEYLVTNGNADNFCVFALAVKIARLRCSLVCTICVRPC